MVKFSKGSTESHPTVTNILNSTYFPTPAAL
jgi:hypothetical protein